jgi:hypothetical protein
MAFTSAALITCVAPNARARASFAGLTSMAMIEAAPASKAGADGKHGLLEYTQRRVVYIQRQS